MDTKKNSKTLAKREETSLDLTTRQVVKAMEGVRFKDASQEDVGQIIDYISVLYGTPMPSTKAEVMVLVDHLMTFYADFTLEEMKIAMQLNTAGELGERQKPFGAISADFISGVMAEYKEAKMKSMKKVKSSQHQIETPASSTDEEYFIALDKWYQNNDSHPHGWNWEAVRRHIGEEDVKGYFEKKYGVKKNPKILKK